MDQSGQKDVIYTDFEKAFDKIWFRPQTNRPDKVIFVGKTLYS